MTAHLALRDGENLSEAMIQRLLATYPQIPFVTPTGIGTGYSPGSIGVRNGASGADPNHLAIIATGSTMVLTARPGWVMIQKDSGSVSFDPRTMLAVVDSPITATVTANATGSTRNDTVCLRIDQSTAPNADGSNLVTLVVVAGASGGGLSNAPADGALYIPLANVAVANGATSISQGNVTDKRYDRRIQAKMYLGTNTTTAVNVAIPFDTVDYDPNNSLTTGTGAKYTAPVAGLYAITASLQATGGTTFLCIVQINGTGVQNGSFPGSQVVSVVSSNIRLNAGDTVTVINNQGSITMQSGIASCNLSIAWEGPR